MPKSKAPPSLSTILHAKLVLAQSSAEEKKGRKGRRNAKAWDAEKENEIPNPSTQPSLSSRKRKKISVL